MLHILTKSHLISNHLDKLKEMNTALNKINYLESALKEAGFSFEVKRFLWKELSDLYAERKMFERAARAMAAMHINGLKFREVLL